MKMYRISTMNENTGNREIGSMTFRTLKEAREFCNRLSDLGHHGSYPVKYSGFKIVKEYK